MQILFEPDGFEGFIGDVTSGWDPIGITVYSQFAYGAVLAIWCDPGKTVKKDVAPGEYLVEINATGHEKKPFSVAVEDGEMAELTV